MVENNLIVNVSRAFGFYYGVKDAIVRNNTVVTHSYPNTNDKGHGMVMFYGTSSTTGNVFANNIFFSPRTDIRSFQFADTAIAANNTADFNMWSLAKKPAAVSGWGANSVCCQADPKFRAADDYRLTAGSPARDAGDDARCALSDAQGDMRPAEAGCDIGMDEHWP